VTAALELSIRSAESGLVVLAVVGEIDMSNADRFRAALSEAGSEGAGFTVDLTKVAYLDSAGITALLPYASRLSILATALLVPVLRLSGLDSVTTVVT
jgi:anti-sigma B factor antagonist